MIQRSRASGNSPNAQAPKAAARKSRIAQEGARPRSSSAAREEAKVARLNRERDELLQQQRATAEVLKVVSRSTFDLQVVFETLVESAAKLCKADFADIWRPNGSSYRVVASYQTTAAQKEYLATLPITPGRGSCVGRTLLEAKIVHIRDIREDAEYALDLKKLGERRTTLGVPLLRDGTPIGVIALIRNTVRPFTSRQIELVTTFADQAVIAIENTRLLNELRQRTADLSESLEQQTATSEVLGVISQSKFELQPILQSVVSTAMRLCRAEQSVIYRQEEGTYRFAAGHSTVPDYLDIEKGTVILPGEGTVVGRAALTRQVARIDDAWNDPLYEKKRDAKVGGVRSMIGVPLLREAEPIGAIALARNRVEPFTDREIDLVTTFADQAVIAIENVRLFEAEQQRSRELSESLEQQTATSAVLQVISNSPGETEPVFKAILANATRICEAEFGVLHLSEGDRFRTVAFHNAPPAYVDAKRHDPMIRHLPPGSALAQLKETRLPIQIADVRQELVYNESHTDNATRVAFTHLTGVRSLLAIPMVNDELLIGAIMIYRQEVRSFTEKQIELMQSFAAQAVIAIENARLLNELRQRTDDLSESLEQQTATADVLRVISSSPTDIQPVLEAIVRTAGQLCASEYAILFRLRDGKYYPACANNAEVEWVKYFSEHPISVDRGSLVGRTVLDRRSVHIIDCLADPEYKLHEAARLGKQRSMLGVPLLRDGEPIGVLGLLRTSVKPFTEKQIELVTTFADQAVIAIENVRLLNELRESLQQQTATAEVLNVISRSAFDLQPVFETVAESSVRLCGADRAFIFRFDGELLRMVATYNTPQDFKEWVARNPIRPGRHSGSARAALERRTIHIPDVLADPEYSYGAKDVEAIRTVLGVPILKGDELLGVMMIYHLEVRPFADKQIALVETFAGQAAIAIENARLFDDVQKRTQALTESLRQQTATADVLKVISRSAFDLRVVLDTLLQSAAQLCEADQGTVTQRRGDTFYRSVSYGFPAAFAEYVKDRPVELGRDTATGRALLEGKVIHIPDVQADPDYTWKEAQKLGGFRTLLGVPMLREGVPVGVLTLTRTDVRPFTDKQIELVSTFADQAAIAIENVRLFESVEAHTRELAKSLDDLHAAQDRLIQTEKLASLGQLTAGIAHEIKNPLNFVNNFSAVSVELIDELREALVSAHLDSKLRAEISEIADTLQGNLDKVVQHGKRADAIVKNMLLHSRHGSGEHRPADINALVEESLNLAYHGARAEKPGFNMTLERSFDPSAGEVDLFPQEITRVLLNLISNGFYAATKRKAETNGGDYEPTLAAATKNLGDSVEIRIRDNGTGISPGVKEKLFNPFFTTKPAGEGTGLGLSISHDIIVKQHGGSIEVDTKPGEFTEFRIVLPRAAASANKSGGERA